MIDEKNSWSSQDFLPEENNFDFKEKLKQNMIICEGKMPHELSHMLAEKMNYLYINLYIGAAHSINDDVEFMKYCKLEYFSKKFSNKLIFKQQEKNKYMIQITAAFLTKFDKYFQNMLFAYDCLEIEFKPQ